MINSRIDWCDSTWNPVTGCLHGCEYCYARGIAHRFGGAYDGETDYEGEVIWIFEGEETGENHVLDYQTKWYSDDDRTVRNAPYPFYFDPTFHRYRLNEYIDKQGRNIFVCSMADLFGKWVPDSWIKEVFMACDKAPQHNYLFLTKNPNRYTELANKGLLPDRHWYGYSTTKQSDLWAFRHADDCTVKNLFISIEPILEPINAGFSSHCPADWVIIGAETGRRKNKVIPKRKWIESIVTECEYAGIPIFMKSSLAEIWGEPLIQEFPKELRKAGSI